MNAKTRKKEAITVPPGEVVISEIGLMPVVQGLQKEFPGLNKSTVWRWAQPSPVGTDGIIPSRYHRHLLQLAHRTGANLTAEDLIYGRKG